MKKFSIFLICIVSILLSNNKFLFLSSIILSLNTAIFSLIIAFFISIYIIKKGRKLLKISIYISLMLLMISPYIHSLSFMNIISIGNLAYLKTLYILTLYYVPLNLLIFFIGESKIDISYIETAMIYSPSKSTIIYTLIGLLKPYIFSSISLVFILVFSDFTVPSLFQYQVYSFQIFTSYTSGVNLLKILRISFPLIIVNSIALFSLIYNTKEMSYETVKTSIFNNIKLKSTKLQTTISHFSILLVFITIIVIINNFHILADFKTLVNTLNNNINAFIYSIEIPMLATLLALIIVISNKNSKIINYLFITPLIFPGIFIGVIIIKIFIPFNFYYYLINNNFLLIIAMTFKVLPLVYLIMNSAIKTKNKSLIEYGILNTKNKYQRIVEVDIPILKFPIFITILIGFSYLFGDISTAILLLPPGKQLLSLKIYGYLHYGDSNSITALGLAILIIFLIIAFIINKLLRKEEFYDL